MLFKIHVYYLVIKNTKYIENVFQVCKMYQEFKKDITYVRAFI